MEVEIIEEEPVEEFEPLDTTTQGALESTPTKTLEQKIMDSRIPKNESEWWAKRRIEELQDFAIWMTGCGYDFTQHKYFCEKRDKLLKN